MSRPRIYFFLAIVLFLLAVSTRKASENEKKVAKKIPLRYLSADDPSFVFVLDTLYYRNRKFTGYQFALYPNGDTAFVKPCYEGLEEGLIKKWYADRQLAEERFYIAGKKEGVHKAWWPNGNPKFRYEFDNGEFSGSVKEWYESGALFKEFHYVKGYEDGSQKMYWINGKARANYIIKNNRRYGLLGTKNCINVADSVFIQR
jgi:hypothetical protein